MIFLMFNSLIKIPCCHKCVQFETETISLQIESKKFREYVNEKLPTLFLFFTFINEQWTIKLKTPAQCLVMNHLHHAKYTEYD